MINWRKIAKVIIATGEENVPDLVGLCEVENDHCLKDLTENSPLREAGYRYVMTDLLMSVVLTWRCFISEEVLSCWAKTAFLFLIRRWNAALHVISFM